MKYIDLLNDWSGRILSNLSIIIIAIILYDVAARGLFGNPLPWSFAISTQLYALLFMMLGGYAMLHNAHVSVDILSSRFGHKLRLIVELICYLVFFFPFVAVLVVYGYRFASRSWAIEETTWGAAAIPVYPIKTVLVLSGCLLLLQGIAHVARLVAAIASWRVRPK